MYVKNGVGRLKKVLLSKPEYLKAAKINEIAKKWDLNLDIKKMRKEHELFVETYRKLGIEVEFLEPDEERPNSVFARDFGGCIKEGYILGNFKYPIRYKEREDYKQKMEDLGIEMAAECQEGLFEGGDFAFLRENLIAIGLADRSNAKAVEEIQTQISKYGYRVIGVPLKPEYLHLDMCFNLVDENLAVAYKEGLPQSFLDVLSELDIEIISVSEKSIFEHGCNLQAVGDKKVISLKRNTYVNEELKKRRIEVIELDITEILKAGGGPHCMTFPLKRI